MDTETRIFIYRLSRARRIVKNAFGILVRRWWILRHKIQAVVDTIVVDPTTALTIRNI